MVPIVIQCSVISLKQLYSMFMYGNSSYEKSQFLDISIYGKNMYGSIKIGGYSFS